MRTFFFILLSLTVFLSPFFIGAVAASVYALRYRAYEIIILGMFVDAAFAHMTLNAPPIYTMAFGLIVFAVELVKPRFAFYNEPHETL